MIGRHISEALAPVVFLAAVVGCLAIALGYCAGCTDVPRPAISPENALAVKQYDDALVSCQQAARQKPREQRFEAYADCEQAVSKAFCAESPDLQEKWDRCKELAP